jgi:hypothetical protein
MVKMTMVGKREETFNYVKFMWSVSKTGQITEKLLNEKRARAHTHTHTHTHTQRSE